ncbi:hypothetical protein J1N35_025241 [Gossypium stocksii]|uniref:Uncharacterized protein n=1 Tax=Gossypium stocksii TaxID=47602 RepID=A0A9D3V8N5_9ROSI|nr:hypothetical protein J1N35_025241 [Gossypium stocksii]
MSLKRTRLSKTTLENPIVIDEEVKERFDSIFKHQPMMPEKGFNLKSNDVKENYFKEIYDYAKKKKGSAYFPSLITSLCLLARVKTQANLKGQYVQGCITIHDLGRLVGRVQELNQGEQTEPSELETEESTNAAETKANSVADFEEEEFETEPIGPNPAEGTTNYEPKVQPEEEPVKPSVEPEFVTPIPTHASTSKKSELSIMIDMCKFMHKTTTNLPEICKN